MVPRFRNGNMFFLLICNEWVQVDVAPIDKNRLLLYDIIEGQMTSVGEGYF